MMMVSQNNLQFHLHFIKGVRKLSLVEKMRKHKKLICIFGWILLSLIFAFGTECYFNRKVLGLPQEKRGVFEIQMDKLEFEGFENVDGKWILGTDGGRVVYNCERQYVNKIQ